MAPERSRQVRAIHQNAGLDLHNLAIFKELRNNQHFSFTAQLDYPGRVAQPFAVFASSAAAENPSPGGPEPSAALPNATP
jgi:hypothetical protein